MCKVNNRDVMVFLDVLLVRSWWILKKFTVEIIYVCRGLLVCPSHHHYCIKSALHWPFLCDGTWTNISVFLYTNISQRISWTVAKRWVVVIVTYFNPLSTNPTKWSNTLKQFVANEFDHFVRLVLKNIIY